MSDFLLGLVIYTFIAIIAINLSNRRTLTPYLIFVIASFALGVFQAYIFDLPQGGGDARAFMRVAALWSADGLAASLDRYTGPHSYFISWLHAVIFSITTPSVLMANAFSGLFTLMAIHLCVKTSILIWGRISEVRAAWLACLFPTLLLHSALMLREAYFAFFFILAMYNFAKYVQKPSLGSLAVVILALIAALFFHGGAIAAIIAVGAYLIFTALRRTVISLQKRRPSALNGLAMAIIAAVALVGVFASGLNIPKLGEIDRFIDDEVAVEAIIVKVGASRGGAAHPTWTLINNEAELLPKLPVRVAYFLFSPFPWDIRAPGHILGLIDSLLYVMIFAILATRWREIRQNRAAMAVFFVTMMTIIVFSLGTSNFGTGIRHRAKHAYALIAVVSAALPALSLSMKQSLRRRRLSHGTRGFKSRRGWLHDSGQCP